MKNIRVIHSKKFLTTLAILVLSWRIAAVVGKYRQYTSGSLPEEDFTMSLLVAVMGLGFLACGLIVIFRSVSQSSIIFALYAVLAALHWGGPLQSSSKELQMGIWVVYFLLSSILAESLFLHFILRFPRPFNIVARKSTLVFLYLPVVLSSAIAIAIVSFPSASSTLLNVFFQLKTVQTNLFPLLGIIGIVVRFVRANTEERQAFGLTVVLWGNSLAVLPYLAAILVESLVPAITLPGGQGTSPFTLFFLLTPVSFTYAILKSYNSRVARLT